VGAGKAFLMVSDACALKAINDAQRMSR